MTIFLDCDGVLADFDGWGTKLWGMPPREYEAKVGEQAFWKSAEENKDFFLNMERMPLADNLYARVAHMRPVIITGAPRGNWAKNQKLRWRDKHFPNIPMVVCQAAEKYKWCKPGDVLVDDRDKYRLQWECAGGRFILYHEDKFKECIEEIFHYVNLGY